ncbi:MAG TPA: hypothetical protein VG347_05390 [Verrucomicrobiae bacterium]|nr:hypothetical protein [Verrucomicrobiae bacterium]
MIRLTQLRVLAKGKRERVSISEYAAKKGIHRSTASRRLKTKGIPPMEKVYKKKSLQPVGLALLGFNRNQIKMITGVKAERLKARLLKLFYGRNGNQLFLDDAKIEFLEKRMNKLFGMGQHVRDVHIMTDLLDTNTFFNEMRSQASATLDFDTFVKKVQRVLGRKAMAKGKILVIQGGENGAQNVVGKTVSGFSFVVTR